MILEYFNLHISTALSLFIVVVVLVGGVVLSVMSRRGEQHKNKKGGPATHKGAFYEE